MKEPIIAGKTIILNTALNTTFIVSESDQESFRKYEGEKFEWVGELSVSVVEQAYKAIAEKLYLVVEENLTVNELDLMERNAEGKLIINQFLGS